MLIPSLGVNPLLSLSARRSTEPGPERSLDTASRGLYYSAAESLSATLHCNNTVTTY